MSTHKLPKLSTYIPLWRRRIPKYPLWMNGNPQLRVFLPLFWMRPVRPRLNNPENVVCFEVHPQMTHYDVKNYLEKIYKVDVTSVRTALVAGEERRHARHGYKLPPEEPPRFAYVHLAGAQTFKFPEIFKEAPTAESKDEKNLKKVTKELTQQQQKQWQASDVPIWFR